MRHFINWAIPWLKDWKKPDNEDEHSGGGTPIISYRSQATRWKTETSYLKP